jgi:ABC-2 type transport system ATP-binding protein
MIEVTGLTKRYGQITALSNVTFKVEKGQIVGFLGANGAGKTTTMDIVCGCIGADQGSVQVCGVDVTDQPEKAKLHLGYLPDEPPLHNDMKVIDFVRYAAKLHKVPAPKLKAQIDKTIERLSLGTVAHRLVGNLSKGFRQRVGLAQAIVHDPDVLVLDEPTEGLDPNQIVQIRELIRSLAGEHTILLSSHILSEVQNTCDHIVIIHAGQIVRQGTYDEVVQNSMAGAAYHLRVARNASKLVKELLTLDGVVSAKMAPESDRIHLEIKSGNGALDRIARKVLDGDHGLKELVSHSKSLEDVFLQLTH